MLRILCVAALACLLATAAEARHVPGAERSCIPTSDVMRPCAYQPNFLAGVKEIRVKMHRERHATNPQPRLTRQEVVYANPIQSVMARSATTEIVSHPTGCPHIAFCGCGAAVRVFGSPVRSLWVAAEWIRRFPRALPAPGMVAARAHHVFVLEADLGGGVWQVFDANSGQHLTRVHARSLAGYVVVNPHGASS